MSGLLRSYHALLPAIPSIVDNDIPDSVPDPAVVSLDEDVVQEDGGVQGVLDDTRNTANISGLEMDDEFYSDEDNNNHRSVLEEAPLGSDVDVSDSDSNPDNGAADLILLTPVTQRVRGAGHRRGARRARGSAGRGSSGRGGLGRGGKGRARGRGRRGGAGRGRGRTEDQRQDAGLDEGDEGWVEAGRKPHIKRFTETPGPKGEAADLAGKDGTRPIDFFLVFCDENLLDHLVVETNRYAAQSLGLDPYHGPLPR